MFCDLSGLKDRIKKSAEEAEASGTAGVAFSPRETSLSVVRHRTDRDEAEGSFFELLEAEVRVAMLFCVMHVIAQVRCSGTVDESFASLSGSCQARDFHSILI